MGSRLPEGTDITYTYSYEGAGAAQSWVGAGRYAVVDFAAGPTRYGPANGVRGAVVPSVLPRLAAAAKMPRAVRGVHRAALTAHLVSVVVSAVRHVLVPDVQCDFAEFAEKVHHAHSTRFDGCWPPSVICVSQCVPAA